MKKFAIVLAVLATLVGNVGYAQGTSGSKRMGNAAQSGGVCCSDPLAWGIGLGALVVVGVVVGVAAGFSGNPSTSFIH